MTNVMNKEDRDEFGETQVQMRHSFVGYDEGYKPRKVFRMMRKHWQILLRGRHNTL